MQFLLFLIGCIVARGIYVHGLPDGVIYFFGFILGVLFGNPVGAVILATVVCWGFFKAWMIILHID